MAEPDCIRSRANRRGKFYIYEHVRESDGRVFYVGKGSRYRMTTTQHRSPYWVAVSRKHGWRARAVFRTDDEELAFLAEMELIRKRRNDGSPLTNLTDGGEGLSGYKFPKEVAFARVRGRIGKPNLAASRALKGVPKTEEHRRNLSQARMGYRYSDEVRRKMSLRRKGCESPMKGKKHRPESRAAISASITGEKNPFFGRKHSPESLRKMSIAHTGVKRSEESRRKQSASVSGARNHNFGKEVSPERREKQRRTLMARPKLECPHCGRLASDGNAKRWHFDNCRERK